MKKVFVDRPRGRGGCTFKKSCRCAASKNVARRKWRCEKKPGAPRGGRVCGHTLNVAAARRAAAASPFRGRFSSTNTLRGSRPLSQPLVTRWPVLHIHGTAAAAPFLAVLDSEASRCWLCIRLPHRMPLCSPPRLQNVLVLLRRARQSAPLSHTTSRACGPLAHFQPTPAFLPDSSPDRLTTVQLSSSAACTCQISLSLVSLVPPSSQTVGDSQLRQMPFPFGCRALQLLRRLSSRLHFFA